MAKEAGEADSARLPWPPMKEDLQRLYLDQKLSAAKIADAYDLRYTSSKTAESTVLYHLKRNGITRRDPAAHIRKVSDAMVGEWLARYQKGESLKQIAGETVSAVTVFNHLHKRGIQLREKVEAQIVAVSLHDKKPFHGTPADEAYLSGLAVGDLGVDRHGRAIRVKLSTTHPAMGVLFRNLFSSKGPIYEYPRLDKLVGHQWAFDCDLDPSYEFLGVAKGNPTRTAQHEGSFLSFVAGFFDAEGSIYFHRKRMGGAFELSITNTNFELLAAMVAGLASLGFHSVLKKVRVDREKAIKSGMTNPSESMWRITIWRFEDVNRLLQALELRHPEKKAKAKIALRFGFEVSPSRRADLLREWYSLIASIHIDCQQYIASAKAAWEAKHRLERPQ